MSFGSVGIAIPCQENLCIYAFTMNVTLSEMAVNISLFANPLLRAILVGFARDLLSSRNSGIGLWAVILREVESESRPAS